MASRIAGVENVPHIVGTGENRVLLALPDVYGTLGAAIGVTKLVGDPPAGVQGTTVSRAIAEGQVRKIKITYIGATKLELL
jgi:hypothetical protein